MLFRHVRAAAAVGQCARRSATPVIARVPIVLLARATRIQPATTSRTQTRLSSSVAAADAALESEPSPANPTSDAKSPSGDEQEILRDISDILFPPWQSNDLTAPLRAAIEAHGPTNFIEHLTGLQKAKAMKNARSRRTFAETAEKEVGPNWYAVLQRYNVTVNAEHEATIAAEIAKVRKERAELYALWNYDPENSPEGISPTERNVIEQGFRATKKRMAELGVADIAMRERRWEDMRKISQEMEQEQQEQGKRQQEV